MKMVSQFAWLYIAIGLVDFVAEANGGATCTHTHTQAKSQLQSHKRAYTIQKHYESECKQFKYIERDWRANV